MLAPALVRAPGLIGPDRLQKIFARYELFKLAHDVSGDVVECGVFKGARPAGDPLLTAGPRERLDLRERIDGASLFRSFERSSACTGGIFMRKQACVAMLIVLFLATEAATEDWPPLPKKGFISGRVATPADVAAGNAVFSAAVGGGAVGKSTPIRIKIPQYAYYKEGGKKIPVIVLQAERIDIQGAKAVQMTSVGALLPDGKKVIGLLTSFELLGQAPPTSSSKMR